MQIQLVLFRNVFSIHVENGDSELCLEAYMNPNIDIQCTRKPEGSLSLSCGSGGGAQCGAPAEVLSQHHVQSSAVLWQIHLGLRQRQRRVQEG